MAQYPTTPATFPVRFDGAGNFIFASHMNGVQDEITALTTGLVNGLFHHLLPNATNTRDLGSASLKWRDLHLAGDANVAGDITGATLAVTGHAYQTRTFAAGNYTGSGSMTWTVESGDVKVEQWVRVEDFVIFQFDIFPTSVGGTVDTELRVALPVAAHATNASWIPYWFNDNGTLGLGLAKALGSTLALFHTDPTATWAAATDATTVRGTVIYQAA